MQPHSTPEHHAGTADALYAYLSDCQFDEHKINTGCLALALEYVYQPHPRFWRDFDLAYLIDAIARCVPDWRGALNRRGERYADEVMRDLEGILENHAFDEAGAEMLQPLPVQERPSERHSAFEWISAQLAKKGAAAELEFARRYGYRCGEGALEVLYCLEAARAGRVAHRLGTLVARDLRDRAMKDANGTRPS